MVTFKHKHALPLFASLGITLTVTFTFTQILSYGKSSCAQPHFLRTLKSQPVKKTDGGEFRHPDIPCFQVIRAFDIRCLIAFRLLT